MLCLCTARLADWVWMMTLIRSNGATLVFAMAPAIPPKRKLYKKPLPRRGVYRLFFVYTAFLPFERFVDADLLIWAFLLIMSLS